MPDKPTGVLPKNLQQWAIIGVTLVVAAVILFSMINTPKPKLGSSAADQELLRIKSEKEKQLEQLNKDQERAQQQNLEEQQKLLEAIRNQPQPSPAAPEAPDPLQEAKIKREYTSLFASQLAKTYRTDVATRSAGPAPVDAGATTTADVDPYSQLARSVEQRTAQPTSTPDADAAPSTALASALAGASHAQPPAGPPRPTDTPTHARVNTMGRNVVRPGAPTYLLLEGTVIETALVTRITSDFSGPVIVQASGPILTQNRQHILIPAGSKVIGEARRVEAFGQTRLAVYFHRLLMPDGFSVDLDREPALTARGETGLNDKTNNHYFKIFGSSIAVGLVGGLSALGANIPTTTNNNASALDAYRLGVAGSLGQTASQILEKFLNILPTVTIREGHRVRVWISKDLTLPAYVEHAMPKDL